MINLPKISLDWDLVTEPDFYNTAKELLRGNARFALEQSIKHPTSDWADSSINIGDDFSKIYYFDLGHATRKVINCLNQVTSDILGIEQQRFGYGDDFFNDLREALIKKFGDVSCCLAYINTSFEEDAELLITTKYALKGAGFRFSDQYSVAIAPNLNCT